LHGRVDDSVRLPYQLAGGSGITLLARQPLERSDLAVEAVPVAAGPVPASQLVTGGDQPAHDVTAKKPSGSRNGDTHGGSSDALRLVGKALFGLGAAALF